MDHISVENSATEEFLSKRRCSGIMGVPITFLDKYNPEQFEIIGLTQRGCHDESLETKNTMIFGKCVLMEQKQAQAVIKQMEIQILQK